ncbi:hypothetical protein K435DRAFT_790368 [Dendrothele bispora CBS 962.96]|uniref:Uncharacterized protein n=1 Tax=Dendrothele bispora (strain CBS 962.96) TaxID=1314807 RepID=A0A4S8MQN2_DENBC|nr:hypothetical protein K435DRAFT_790368 [Dendrothele bispora CBS 962.96]
MGAIDSQESTWLLREAVPVTNRCLIIVIESGYHACLPSKRLGFDSRTVLAPRAGVTFVLPTFDTREPADLWPSLRKLLLIDVMPDSLENPDSVSMVITLKPTASSTIKKVVVQVTRLFPTLESKQNLPKLSIKPPSKTGFLLAVISRGPNELTTYATNLVQAPKVRLFDSEGGTNTLVLGQFKGVDSETVSITSTLMTPISKVLVVGDGSLVVTHLLGSQGTT